MASKAPTAYLFHELRSKNVERTDAIGKAFTRYRRSLGIQEGNGRRSRVNFHSLRRWFITTAINAGQSPHVVSLVVGHKEGRKGMTLGRYWQGADDPALRACVEAVKLPEGVHNDEHGIRDLENLRSAFATGPVRVTQIELPKRQPPP